MLKRLAQVALALIVLDIIVGFWAAHLEEDQS